MIKALLAVFSVALSVVGVAAQSAPTITVRKGDRFAVAVDAISGADGAAVKKVLENDLRLAGLFDLVPRERAAFVASGASGAALEGRLADAAGRTVVAASFDGDARMKAHRFADEIVRTLTGRPGMASARIAFVASRTGRKEIYTADYDGSNVKQITNDRAISVGPNLGAGGRKLAYTGYQAGYADIYVIDLASGARNRVLKYPGTNSGAAFSPDGGRLAATLSKDGNPELYVASASGSGARRLTRTRGAEASPTWSPDGGEIIYVSDERGGPQLYRIPASGGSGRLLQTGHGYCTEPSWSPDGTKVAFNVRGGGGFQIAILDLNSGGTRIVPTGGNAEDPAWGPNSRHLIYSSGSALMLLDTATGQSTAVVTGLGKVSEPTWAR